MFNFDGDHVCGVDLLVKKEQNRLILFIGR
jgi:hypothetical protein